VPWSADGKTAFWDGILRWKCVRLTELGTRSRSVCETLEQGIRFEEMQLVTVRALLGYGGL
jgi:hypothetical protein